jgi:coenzyme PQQ precursor peptide PqqA
MEEPSMWEKPAYTEIDMNAEIGAYQDESDGDENTPVIEDSDAE